MKAAGKPGGRYGLLNAPFQPARTDYDWLSRDETTVDAYVADPRCEVIAELNRWLDRVIDGLHRRG